MASATDIITYIGVPLAVLGVLPILYNTALTLAALSKVKRTLKKSRLAGITRGDVINHVIEVELPRFTIAPLDREEQSSSYWAIYDHPSLVPGGTWTIFNWKMHPIGLKTQRIEYADQLRQPQADIGFEELVSYLLDLGAVPNPIGFRMLRTSGLWIPTGTALLWSPDNSDKCLSIAPLDDSDGNLSLAVRWSRKWRVRDKLSLPPYWLRIEGPDAEQTELDGKNQRLIEETGVPQEEALQNSPFDDTNTRPSTKEKGDHSSINKEAYEKSTETVRCHISSSGLISAMPEENGLGTMNYLPVEHLSIRETDTISLGIYFASAATALGASTKTILWNYHTPHSLLAFARKDAIPCGILVLLSSVAESDTPEWATQYLNDEEERREASFKRMREDSEAFRRESTMTPEQRSASQRERHMRSAQSFMDERREAARREETRKETRMLEALQSPRWDNGLVGSSMLAWLKAEGHVCESFGLNRAVEVLLYKLLIDLQFAARMADMMETWRCWVENGGMKKADFAQLKERIVEFAYASLLLAAIRSSMTATEGSLAMDLQESLRIWKRVRLG